MGFAKVSDGDILFGMAQNCALYLMDWILERIKFLKFQVITNLRKKFFRLTKETGIRFSKCNKISITPWRIARDRKGNYKMNSGSIQTCPSQNNRRDILAECLVLVQRLTPFCFQILYHLPSNSSKQPYT
jgi:hypothetical protein